MAGLFTGLDPLLNNRTVLFTLTKLVDGRLNLVIAPQITNKDSKDDHSTVFTQSLQATGTAAELDDQIPSLLTSYVTEALGFTSNMAEVKKTLDEAAAIEKAAAANKVNAAKKKAGDKTGTSKVENKPKPEPAELSLFGAESDVSGVDDKEPEPEPPASSTTIATSVSEEDSAAYADGDSTASSSIESASLATEAEEDPEWLLEAA